MTESIFTKIYRQPEIDKGEILRYMGSRQADERVNSLMEECLSEVLPKLVYKTCYRQFAIHVESCKSDLSFMISHSKDLNKNLIGCDRIIVFAATIGIEIDRLISKYGRLSPAKALCFQAIGAERIESLCETFNNDMRERCAREGSQVRPRFSPGYGDFPLEAQKDIFRVLDCYRKIGLSLNDSLLMSPSKSVTALIGVKPKCVDAAESDGDNAMDISDMEQGSCDPYDQCQNCKKQDCSFSRR